MKISLSKVYLLRQNNTDLDQKHCLFPCNFADFNVWAATLRKFAVLCICYLQINHYKVEDFQMAHLGYLQICNCGMSPLIWDFQTNKRNLHAHL